jgi:hypothetical protein
MSTTFNYALAHQKLLAVSPMRHSLDDGANGGAPTLPPPFFEGADELKFSKSGVVFCGSSAVFLQPIELARPAGDGENSDGDEDGKIQGVQDFELHYMPVSKGFSTVGGLRVILLEDKYLEDSSDAQDDKSPFRPEAKILKEWDIVAEVWVST